MLRPYLPAWLKDERGPNHGGAVMQGIIVKAYYAHKLEDFVVYAGDLIEWKRNGFSGYQWARVTAIGPGHTKVRIMPCAKPGFHFGGSVRQRWITVGAIIKVYDSGGQPKRPFAGPENPFIGKVHYGTD